MWRAYKKAIEESDLDLDHDIINHKYHFVDPTDRSVHTQNIEGLFSRSKYFLSKKKGSSLEQRSFYLAQFLWTYKIDEKYRFGELLNILNKSIYIKKKFCPSVLLSVTLFKI